MNRLTEDDGLSSLEIYSSMIGLSRSRTQVFRILTVFDCGRGVSKERESVYAVWNVPAE